MTLREENTYKQLLLKRDAFKILFDITVFADYSNGEKEVEDFIVNSNLLKRLQDIYQAASIGLIDLKDLLNDSGFFKEICLLEEKYPHEKAHLKSIESDITHLNIFLWQPTSFCLKLMTFIDNYGHLFDDKYRRNLIVVVRDFLRILPYSHDSKERIYLSQKYSQPLWYEAYLLENPTVPESEHSFLIEELLKTVLLAPSKNDKFKYSLKRHLSYEGATVSQEIFYRLILTSKENKEKAQLALSVIRDSQKTPIAFPECFSEMHLSLGASNINLATVIQLFDSFYFAYYKDEWMRDFARFLLTIDETLCDSLLEYAKNTYHRATIAFLEDEYIIARNELQKSRKNFVITLRAIKDLKNDVRVIK